MGSSQSKRRQKKQQQQLLASAKLDHHRRRHQQHLHQHQHQHKLVEESFPVLAALDTNRRHRRQLMKQVHQQQAYYPSQSQNQSQVSKNLDHRPPYYHAHSYQDLYVGGYDESGSLASQEPYRPSAKQDSFLSPPMYLPMALGSALGAHEAPTGGLYASATSLRAARHLPPAVAPAKTKSRRRRPSQLPPPPRRPEEDLAVDINEHNYAQAYDELEETYEEEDDDNDEYHDHENEQFSAASNGRVVPGVITGANVNASGGTRPSELLPRPPPSSQQQRQQQRGSRTRRHDVSARQRHNHHRSAAGRRALQNGELEAKLEPLGRSLTRDSTATATAAAAAAVSEVEAQTEAFPGALGPTTTPTTTASVQRRHNKLVGNNNPATNLNTGATGSLLSTSTSQYSSHSSNSNYASREEEQQKSRSNHLHQSSNNYNNTHTTYATSTTDAMQAANKQHQNKGLAYAEAERRQLGLVGLLPDAHQDQELQVRAVVNYLDNCAKDDLAKYVYLRNLKDFNEQLFYQALQRNVGKMMPIVYTPTVGLGCQKFSEIYMRPRGLFVRSKDAGQVSQLLANWPENDVRVIVVTDGERILGLGDLGANGMGISIGKLSLYTALAGIPPKNTLPVTLDVGTNNEQYLQDPFYIGQRQQRVRGEQYERLVEEFMRAVTERWGRTCLIQFEDFANATAFNLLQKHRNHFCTFNDDIQGTASVCLSGLISAAGKLLQRRMADLTFLFYGAGEANLGTANLLMMAMQEEGASEQEARRRIWLVDSKGLVVSSRQDLSHHKRAFAQDGAQMSQLLDIIAQVKPAAIVGASAQGGAFNEQICKKMAELNDRPIIFALSNPTIKAECTAQEAYQWTEGRCVFASGSPFDPVKYGGKTYVTGQGNNAYIFPAVGLAAIAAHVHTIPEETFLVAARALSDQLLPQDIEQGLVYPSLTKIRDSTLRVATRVLEYFYSERLATYRPEPDDKLQFLKEIQYDPRY